MKTIHGAAAAAAGMLGGLLLGILLLLLAAGGFSEARAALKYATVLRVLRRDYVAAYDVDKITDEAVSGAIEGLDDRWSYYMDAEAYTDYKDYSANRYQGIGVTVSKDGETGGFLVLTVTKDGPAHRAGVTPGDIILAVDGTDVTPEERDAAFLRSLIQADFGKEARVTVRREDGSETDLDVSCEVIYTSPVSYALLDGNVGYVAVANFRQGAAENAVEAVEALVEEGADRIVFDVRTNPGGQVSEMVELLDYLLPEGDIFIRADKRGREEVDTSDADCLDLPMAVIVNGESYSAAEYFAAALREYGRAVVVGEPTTGKARSQISVELSDGSAVHISKYTYLTPQRNDLNESGGIVPDIEAALTEEERTELDTGWLEPENDPQVQAAVAAIS